MDVFQFPQNVTSHILELVTLVKLSSSVRKQQRSCGSTFLKLIHEAAAAISTAACVVAVTPFKKQRKGKFFSSLQLDSFSSFNIIHQGAQRDFAQCQYSKSSHSL